MAIQSSIKKSKPLTERQQFRLRKGHSNAGRRSVIDQGKIDKLEQAFSWGCSDREACLFADIHPDTLYNYQVTHPEFVVRKELLKERPTMQARQSVIKSFTTRPDIAIKYLERKVRNEFAIRTEVENTFPDGIAIKDLRELPDDKKFLDKFATKKPIDGK